MRHHRHNRLLVPAVAGRPDLGSIMAQQRSKRSAIARAPRDAMKPLFLRPFASCSVAGEESNRTCRQGECGALPQVWHCRHDRLGTFAAAKPVYGQWGLRGVRVKGGKTRDIPLPSAVTRFLQTYIEQILAAQMALVTPDTPLFWSTWGRRSGGKTRAPMTGQNIWRLCKVYGRLIGYPMLKPHDLRHGVALEVLAQHHDLEQVRALLGHARIDTAQIYTTIRPPQLKRAVAFYEEQADQMRLND